MSFGSEPDIPEITPPPEQMQIGGYTDYVANQSLSTRKGADGMLYVDVDHINKDPAEEAFMGLIKGIGARIIPQIERIATSNPRMVAPIAVWVREASNLNGVSDADALGVSDERGFEERKQFLLNLNDRLAKEEWDDFDHQQEIKIAAQGIDGTELAHKMRADARKGRIDSRQKGMRDAELMATQLNAADQERFLKSFGVRESARDKRRMFEGQKLSLEQEALDKQNAGEEIKLKRLSDLLGMSQSIEGADLNKKRGMQIAPTALGYQQGENQLATQTWGQSNQLRMQRYGAEVEAYKANQGLWGNVMQGVGTIGGMALGGWLGGGAGALGSASGSGVGAATSSLIKQSASPMASFGQQTRNWFNGRNF